MSTERAPDLAAGRHAAWAFLAVMALVAALVRIDVDVPLVGHLGAALVAVTFLYAPSVIAWRRREDLADYGFRLAPVGRGLAIAAAFVLGVLPLFVAGYVLFFRAGSAATARSPTWRRPACACAGSAGPAPTSAAWAGTRSSSSWSRSWSSP